MDVFHLCMYSNVAGLLCSQGKKNPWGRSEIGDLRLSHQDEWSPVIDSLPPGEKISPKKQALCLVSIHPSLLPCVYSQHSASYQLHQVKCHTTSFLAHRNLHIPLRCPLHQAAPFVHTGSMSQGWHLRDLVPYWWRTSSELSVLVGAYGNGGRAGTDTPRGFFWALLLQHGPPKDTISRVNLNSF